MLLALLAVFVGAGVTANSSALAAAERGREVGLLRAAGASSRQVFRLFAAEVVTVDVGYTILLTASLSFLGLGGKPPTPEWGSMIATSRPYFLSYWWTVTFPGLAMFLSVVIFSLLGDALYELFGIRGERHL